MKPFLPQLQTMYVKCLADPTEPVRQKAGESLGTLVRLSTRTEPLINELATNVSTNENPAVRQAMGTALGEVLLNVPQPTSEATQSKLLDCLLPKAFGGDGERREREVTAWAFAMLVRRHLPAEQAIEVLQENVSPGLTDEQPAVRHGAVHALAGACWCQASQLPAPGEELLTALKDILALASLPKLLADGDPEVQVAAAVLMAGAARLHSSASLPWAKLSEAEDKLAALVAPSSGLPARVVLSAARHYAASAGLAGVSVGAKLAVAVAARGTDKSCEVPEDAERALAAALGVKEGDEAQAKTKVEKLAGALDGKASQVLRDYAKTRLSRIAQYSVEGDFAWDF